MWAQLPVRVDIQTQTERTTMKQHRDTEPTPTSLRREEAQRRRKRRRLPMWQDTARVNEWCGWRMKCEATQSLVRTFSDTEQAWS